MTAIKDANLKFPQKRTVIKKVEGIVIHHPVADWTVKEVHDYFVHSKGWNGIAYNYYVQKNGEAFYGRSSENQEYKGAHAGEHNATTLGVSAEGNFDKEKMKATQYNKLLDVVVHLCKKHNLTEKDVKGHKEMSGANTACPGRYFDLDKFRSDVKDKLNPPKPKNNGKLYKVQVGAFANKDNADRLAKELEGKGYSTYIVQD